MLAAAWAECSAALLADPPTPNPRPANLSLRCSYSTSTSQMRACSSTPTSRTWCVGGCRRQGLHPAMLHCRQSKLLSKPCFVTAGRTLHLAFSFSLHGWLGIVSHLCRRVP